MLIMLLHHTLHRAQVSVAKRQHQWPFGISRTVGAHLEFAALAEREGDDPYVLVPSLEESLVVSMPAHGVIPVLIQVEIAGIWPLNLSETAVTHDLPHEILHPGRKGLRCHFGPPVAVPARTPIQYHPPSFPRHRTNTSHWLSPVRSHLDSFEELRAFAWHERTLQITHKGPSNFVHQGILPSWSFLTKEHTVSIAWVLNLQGHVLPLAVTFPVVALAWVEKWKRPALRKH
mmetsp:Transcript_7237/g.19792  ORF Transcript_7237/g.19792 Transcript_7237/m.19792 type:complete len:231 (+) Transcript_7237:235-927(+)